jgi:hypothetical protein
MKTDSFEKENLDWWLQQLQQRIGEWWELQLSKLSNLNIPDYQPPTNWDIWLKNSLIFFCFAFIFWIIWRFHRRFLRYFYQLKNLNLQPKPETPIYSVSYWVARSQDYQTSGDYYQACRCLYFAMLQQLHETAWIPHQPSRTDEEYRLLILEFPQPDPYERLFIIHQELCFGKRDASAQLLAVCQKTFQKILPLD